MLYLKIIITFLKNNLRTLSLIIQGTQKIASKFMASQMGHYRYEMIFFGVHPYQPKLDFAFSILE